MGKEIVVLTGNDLTIEDIIAVSRKDSNNNYAKVVLLETSKAKIIKVRDYIEKNWLKEGHEPVYGFNTGVGVLKSEFVSFDKLKDFQRLYIKSHSVGVGEPYDIDVVRAAILIRVNSFAKGHSGIRINLVEKLIEMLNKEITPVVPEIGSLGASGDLAPLSHVGAVLTGEPEAKFFYANKTYLIKDVGIETEEYKIGSTSYSGVKKFEFTNANTDEKITFETLELEAKEAMAITNGATFVAAVACIFAYDAENFLKFCDLTSAMSLEAMNSEKDAFHEDLHRVRNLQGQITTAKNIRNLISDSQRMEEVCRKTFFDNLPQNKDKKYKKRVQDRYSLRCVPQVHGASKDTFNYFKNILVQEINAATDNPLIFEQTDGSYVARSGGNFHGQPLAIPLDAVGIAIAEMANISDRRIFSLVNSDLSYGLPGELTGVDAEGLGMNTGLMLTQYTTASLVSENKVLAHPSSVDSITSSGNQEDHVSMGSFSARKARMILKNAKYVLAIEMLNAIQALYLSSDVVSFDTYKLSEKIATLFNYFTDNKKEISFPKIIEDIYLKTSIDNIHNVVYSESFLNNFVKALEV